MTCHIVVEGKADEELLGRILEANQVQGFSISAGGGKSSALSFAQSILASRREPVALVIDADTSHQRAVEEQEQIYYDLLRSVSRTTPYRIFSAVPELATVLFSDADVLSRIVGAPVSEPQLREAEYRPRKVLDALLAGPGAARDQRSLVGRIDDEMARRLAEHPLLRSIIGFVENPTMWSPQGLAA